MKKITLLLLLCTFCVLQVFGQTKRAVFESTDPHRFDENRRPHCKSGCVAYPVTKKVPPKVEQIASEFLTSKKLHSDTRTLLTAPADDCSGATALTVPATVPTCANIGTTPPATSTTSMMSAVLGETDYTSSTTTPLPGAPSPDVNCGFYAGGTIDAWVTLTVPAGAAGFSLNLAVTALSVQAGTTFGAVFAQAYTGTCTALAAVGTCNILASTSGTTYTSGYPVNFTGFTAGQVVRIRLYTYTDDPVSYSDDWTLGSIAVQNLPPPPANESCNACTPNATSGCNLGAPDEANWSGPSAATTSIPPGAGIICNGNSWISVDNPVYFCFTSTMANPTITVNGIACNGGAGGAAQFGAFSSCASITGTAAMWNSTNFFGCAAGSGTVALNTAGIAAGQSFIVVVDGTSGDNCRWNFLTAGVLPLEMMNFTGYKERSVNILNWTTANEVNNDHFMVEKSLDGTKYETLGKVSSTAKGNQKQSYSFSDERPNSGITYYRLKQIGTDGSETYSQVISITRKDEKFAIHNLFPSPAVQSMTLEFESVATAPVEARIIDSYGRMLKNFRIESVRNGINYFQIDELSDLSQGMYFLQLSNGSEQILQRFIKN